MEVDSLSLFNIYLPGRFHLVSVALAGSTVLIIYYLQPNRIKRIHRFRNAMLISVLAHFLYEDLFTFYSRQAGLVDSYTVKGVSLYWSMTFMLAGYLAYVNKTNDILKYDHFSVLFYFYMIVLFTCMYMTGFFHALKHWFEGGPDPHGMLWAASKATGFWAWFFAVKRK